MVLRRFLAYVTYRDALLWFCGPAAGCPAWASFGDEVMHSIAIIVVKRGGMADAVVLRGCIFCLGCNSLAAWLPRGKMANAQ